MTINPPFENDEVAAVFHSYSDAVKEKLLAVRQLVFEVAAEQDLLIKESLKWGQPSYSSMSSGTPIRLAQIEEDRFALHVHCQTSIIDQLRTEYSDQFSFEGTRGVHLNVGDELPVDFVRECIVLALRYNS